MGNLELASETIEQAKELVKDDYVYYLSGKILYQLEHYEGAIEEFSKFFDLSYNWLNYKELIRIGECYINLENYDRATENLIKGRDVAVTMDDKR